jgi:tRNA-intron endonuclease
VPGILKENSVLIADQKESSQIYNRGNFGYPMSGGSLELDLIEATFLLEAGRLEVLRGDEKMTFESLFTYSSSSEGFDIRYMVYRDIRQRGFVVKTETGDHDLSIFPRGKTLSSARPRYLVKTVSERTAFSTDAFMGLAETTESKGRELLFAIADEEGDITYYIVRKRSLSGSADIAGGAIDADCRLIKDRVFVFDADAAASIYGNGAFGKMTDGVLQMSLIETCYLMSKGIIKKVSSENGGRMKLTDMMRSGRSAQDEFDLRFKAFSDMRDNGLTVKTGFKYGTHFRVYEGHPDSCHARFLVHSVDGPRVIMWPEISRAVRLAHGVKKEILFCRVKDGAEYLEFKRFRP